MSVQTKDERIGLVTQLARLIIKPDELPDLVRKLTAPDDAPIEVSLCEGDPHAAPGPTPCVLHHAGAYWLWQGGGQAKNDPQRYQERERARDMLKAACEAQGVSSTGRFYLSPVPGVPLDDPAKGLPAGDAPQVDAIEETRQAREGDPPPYTPILDAIQATDWLKQWRMDREYKAKRGAELVEVIKARWATLHIDDSTSAGQDAITWITTATGKTSAYVRGRLWTKSKEAAEQKHGGMPELNDIARGAVLVLAEG